MQMHTISTFFKYVYSSVFQLRSLCVPPGGCLHNAKLPALLWAWIWPHSMSNLGNELLCRAHLGNQTKEPYSFWIPGLQIQPRPTWTGYFLICEFSRREVLLKSSNPELNYLFYKLG